MTCSAGIWKKAKRYKHSQMVLIISNQYGNANAFFMIVNVGCNWLMERPGYSLIGLENIIELQIKTILVKNVSKAGIMCTFVSKSFLNDIALDHFQTCQRVLIACNCQ